MLAFRRMLIEFANRAFSLVFFLNGIIGILLLITFLPFLIVPFGQLIARKSMKLQKSQSHGGMNEKDRTLNEFQRRLKRRCWIAFWISFPPFIYLEWLWIQYLYSFFPFFS